MITKRNGNRRALIRKLNTSSTRSTSDYSAYDVLSGIHKADSCMVEYEVKCMNSILAKKAKNVNEAKSQLLNYLMKSKKMERCMNLSENRRKIRQSDSLDLRQDNGKKFAYTFAGGDLTGDPYSPISPPNNQRYSSFATRFKKKVATNQTPAKCSRNKLSESADLKSSKRERQFAKSQTLHKYITELNKIIYSDNLPNAKRENDLMRKTFLINNEWLLEEYKQERIKRTQDILDDINTTDANTIQPWYDYKLGSIINHEEEALELKQKLRRMLKDPKRMVAKIEKSPLGRRKIRALLQNKPKH